MDRDKLFFTIVGTIPFYFLMVGFPIYAMVKYEMQSITIIIFTIWFYCFLIWIPIRYLKAYIKWLRIK